MRNEKRSYDVSFGTERLPIDNKKYIEQLHKYAAEKSKKIKTIIDEKDWAVFDDYTNIELKRIIYNLLDELTMLGVKVLEVSVDMNQIGSILEPKFLVFLPKEYRGDVDILNGGMLPEKVSTKRGYKEITIEYHIFN